MKTCPTCQQTYPDETESCPHDGAQLTATVREERECPCCAELILKKARVCKHCGGDVEPATKSDTPGEIPSPATPQPSTSGGKCTSAPLKKRSILSVSFRCVFAFMGLRCIFGLLTIALLSTTAGRNALYNFAMVLLMLAYGIGVSYLLAYLAAESAPPILRTWKIKLVVGIGLGTVAYFGYEWLFAVGILPAWYFLSWRRQAIKW